MIPVRTGVSYAGLSPSDSLTSLHTRTSVIISIGAAYTLIGVAGEPEPRWIIKSEFKHPDTPGMIYSYLGIIEMLKMDESKRIGYDAVSAFLENLFMRYLLINPETTRIIILESMTCPFKLKHCIADILFRRFKAPLLEFLPSQPLSLIPLNKKSGIIVDVGYSETTVLPVVSNSPLTHAMISNPVGAKTVHSRISQLLKSYPCSLPEGYILEDGIDSDPDAKALAHPLDAVILEDLCLQLCYVQTLGSGNDNASQYVPYIDRFGRLYRISKRVRAEASNILFRDEDKETPTVVNSILSSLLALSVDLRAKTAHKILLVGGTSLMRGFSTRLMQELELQVVSNPKFESLKALSGHFEFLESAKFYHPHLQWIGASVDATIEGTHTANQIQSSEFLQNKKPLPDWSSLTSHK